MIQGESTDTQILQTRNCANVDARQEISAWLREPNVDSLRGNQAMRGGYGLSIDRLVKLDTKHENENAPKRISVRFPTFQVFDEGVANYVT